MNETEKIAVIIIRNPQGEYFVHQRRADKRTFPNLYGLGAGGHVNVGESASNAAERELYEETRVEAKPKYLFSFPFRLNGPSYEVTVFEAKTSREPIHDNFEWQTSQWMSSEGINALYDDGKLCPDTAELYRIYRQL